MRMTRVRTGEGLFLLCIWLVVEMVKIYTHISVYMKMIYKETYDGRWGREGRETFLDEDDDSDDDDDNDEPCD